MLHSRMFIVVVFFFLLFHRPVYQVLDIHLDFLWLYILRKFSLKAVIACGYK